MSLDQRFAQSSGVFAEILAQGKAGIVTLFFEHCLVESFNTDNPPMRHITEAEVKRRFEITAKIFEQLRGELKWGLDRIFELMPQYVRDELDGVKWSPLDTTFWVPTGDVEQVAPSPTRTLVQPFAAGSKV